MSDEAFARRFYSDRAELRDLGVPLHSQRDEFTGEELYTLRSENYFLPAARADRRRAGGAADVLLPARGQVRVRGAAAARAAEPRARPSRPRGRGADRRPPCASRCATPTTRPRCRGAWRKLETAISKQRTVKFAYRAMASGEETERTLNPYGLLHDRGVWYVIGHDLDRDDDPHASASRASAATSASPPGASATSRLPADFDIDAYRGPAAMAVRRPGRRGAYRGATARRPGGSSGPTAERAARGRRRSSPSTRACRCSPPGCCGRTGAPSRSSPTTLRREVAERLRRVRDRHQGAPPKPSREATTRRGRSAVERPSGPVAPERFGRAPGTARVPARRLRRGQGGGRPGRRARRALPDPAEELEEHLSLLNLVNFGGGCYAVYAELHGDEVHVDKELLGDTFRIAPRLTPLEARAIRLALEFVGPMIAAEAHRPLDRVRRKLEETFGEFELAQTPEPSADKAEEGLVATLTNAIRRRRLVELEYLKEARTRTTTRTSSSRTRSSGGCRTGTSTPGIAPATTSAASGSTGCGARRCSRTSSRHAKGSSRACSRERSSPGCSTRRRSRAGRSSGARGRSSDGIGDQRAEDRQQGVARRRDPPLPR